MSLTVEHLGVRRYAEVWEYQRTLRDQLVAGSEQEYILLCQHHPVITLGTSSHRTNILASDEQLREKGVELFEVERGGDVTWHAPGQIVAYPIIDLRRRKTDVSWYMRTLEQSVIDTLAAFRVEAGRVAGKTGVWIQEQRKICSMGVKISRWCTMHGLALNVAGCEWGFELINPCGFAAGIMTTVEKERGEAVAIEEVERELARVMAAKLNLWSAGLQAC